MNFPFYERAPKEQIDCNLCGSKRKILVSKTDRYGLPAQQAQCVDCGLLFLSPRMTAEAYREFYESGHYRELVIRYTEALGKSWSQQSSESDQVRYSQGLSRWLTPFMNGARGGLLLDIGGSVGVVAERLMLDFNLDATVVESSIEEANRARDKGLAVANVRLQDYAAGGNHYDVILLCRTVDHLLDIKGDLERIREWLAPDGLFFVDFVHKTLPKIDHPYCLELRTMVRYLLDTGFKIKTSGQFSSRHTAMLCEGA